MFQNMTCSGAYLRITLSSFILHKLIRLVLIIEMVLEFYVTTMINDIYDYYASLVETLIHMKSLKLKDNWCH